MHELSVCKNIIEIVEDHSRKLQKRVKVITLEIGHFALVEKSALIFSFELVAKNTAAEQAVLQIIDIPARARCESCHCFVTIQNRMDSCRNCGNFSLTLIEGEELRIKSMEVE